MPPDASCLASGSEVTDATVSFFDRPIAGGKHCWQVIKLGGTSIASPTAVRSVLRRCFDPSRHRPLAIVVSALAGTTDTLDDLLRQVVRRPSVALDLASLRTRHLQYLRQLAPGYPLSLAENAIQDRFDQLIRLLGRVRWRGRWTQDDQVRILATGEYLAAEILLAAFAKQTPHHARPRFVDPGELLVAEGPLTDARADLEATAKRVAGRLRQSTGSDPQGCTELWIVPGFFARGHDQRYRLLGRGGSDTAATLLGAALDAERIEIWTDVDGVYPQDPRHQPGLGPFRHLTYDQAEALAQRGAKVLHSRSMAPARAAGVPVWVRNSLRPGAPGTWITDTPVVADRISDAPRRRIPHASIGSPARSTAVAPRCSRLPEAPSQAQAQSNIEETQP
ncbi:MAG: hypothetical protein AAF657_05905 [Acidobacteriota bacterium]